MSEIESDKREIERLLTNVSVLKSERNRLKQRLKKSKVIAQRNQARAEQIQIRLDQIEFENRRSRPETVVRSKKPRGVSFVIIYFDIPRQIERTLLSCSPEFQHVPPGELEVVLVDCSSRFPLPNDIQDRFPHVTQILKVKGQPSPVLALNEGIAATRFDMIALMIDGAHILTPGVVGNALDVREIYPNPVISVPQYMLGVESQNLRNISDPFETEEEDLNALGWPSNGYSLFNYATSAGEHATTHFLEAGESNCLITTQNVLKENGGFDPRYDEPGGGFANLEIFSRLIHNNENSYVILPGEGTFHQDHGGLTTGTSPKLRGEKLQAFVEQHEQVTGSRYVFNFRSPYYFGKVHHGTQNVPMISVEHRDMQKRILDELSRYYAGKVSSGMKTGITPRLTAGHVSDEQKLRPPIQPAGLMQEAMRRNGVDQQSLQYVHCLEQIHKAVKPKLYFEIGVDTGVSFSLARCKSIGVDPDFQISSPLFAPARLFRSKSDKFFAQEEKCKKLFNGGIDLAFIDGMHLSEFALRDFIETEKWMNPGGVILFDDVLPDQIQMLTRKRSFGAWCGDVYKVVGILRQYRPDLKVSVFEAFIGGYRKGLAVVTGADPENRVLQDNYAEIEAAILDGTYDFESMRELEKSMSPEPISSLSDVASRGALASKLRPRWSRFFRA